MGVITRKIHEVLPPIEEMTEQGGSRATTTDPKKSLQTKSSANLVTYSQPKVFTKDIDFVVFGASGFIGRMACLYLAEYPDRDFITRLHLAIAGRSKERLQQLQRELTAINSYMGRISLLTANAFSTDDLDRITARSRCLLNFAGPGLFLVFNAISSKFCRETPFFVSESKSNFYCMIR